MVVTGSLKELHDKLKLVEERAWFYPSAGEIQALFTKSLAQEDSDLPALYEIACRFSKLSKENLPFSIFRCAYNFFSSMRNAFFSLRQRECPSFKSSATIACEIESSLFQKLQENPLEEKKLACFKRIEELSYKPLNGVDSAFNKHVFAMNKQVQKENVSYVIKSGESFLLEIDPRKEVLAKLQKLDEQSNLGILNRSHLLHRDLELVEKLEERGVSNRVILKILDLINDATLSESPQEFFSQFDCKKTFLGLLGFLFRGNIAGSLEDDILVITISVNARASVKKANTQEIVLGSQEVKRVFRIPLELFEDFQENQAKREIEVTDSYEPFIWDPS